VYDGRGGPEPLRSAGRLNHCLMHPLPVTCLLHGAPGCYFNSNETNPPIQICQK
jgi:hypothetical protein